MNEQNEENLPSRVGYEVSDENGQNLMQLRSTELNLFNTDTQHKELDQKSISQLNHLLSVVPTSVTAVAGNAKNLMTCSFEYSQLIQAKDGTGALGTVYKEGTTKFGANARFQEAENLKSLVNTGLLLNIASQALAQKHLADINERLQAIETQVKDIKQFLEQSRFAKIEGFNEHLQRIGDLLREQAPILPETMQILAKSAHEVRAELIHIKKDLNQAKQDIQDFSKSSIFSSSGARAELQEKVKRLSNLQREYMLGMQSLLVANLVLYIHHGGNKEFVLAGEQYIKELKGEGGLVEGWEKAQRTIRLHFSKINPMFELSKSKQANELLIEYSLAKVKTIFEKDALQVVELQNRLVDAQNPNLLLEVENGQVVRAINI